MARAAGVHRGLRGSTGPSQPRHRAPDRPSGPFCARAPDGRARRGRRRLCDDMVIHSPFTFWHHAELRQYAFLRGVLVSEGAGECLAPVLARAAEIVARSCWRISTIPIRCDRTELVAHDRPSQSVVSLDSRHAELATDVTAPPPVRRFHRCLRRASRPCALQGADAIADRRSSGGDGDSVSVRSSPRSEPARNSRRLPGHDRSDHARLPETVSRLGAARPRLLRYPPAGPLPL